MKTSPSRLLLPIVLTLAALLAACGGGDDGSTPIALRDKPLSIDEKAPAAYTIDHLNAHPDELVQPEHLIIATLDPAVPGRDVQSARLYIREPMTLSIDSTGAGAVVSEVSIENSQGHTRIAHRPGDAALTFSLPQGAYRIVFKADPRLKTRQTLFLKLSETPLQSARRSDIASRGNSRAVASANAAPTQSSTPLGTVSLDCLKCDFDNADLSNQDLSYHVLSGSSFNQTNLRSTNFKGATCMGCLFDVDAYSSTDANFASADLGQSTLNGFFMSNSFSGASMDSTTLKGFWSKVGFSTSPGSTPTSLKNADLTGAQFIQVNMQNVDFTGAIVKDIGSFIPGFSASLRGVSLTGARFDHMTPSDLWVSVAFSDADLTGVSFAGMDLSHSDLSVANNVKVDIATLSSGILSNGTTGTNLSGQDLQGFKAWAGSADGSVAGADLRGVNLTNANLFQADLTGVNLSNAILMGADLTNSSLKSARLTGAQLGVAPDSGSGTAANLTQVYMPQADLTDADLRSVKLDGAHAYGNVKFLRARLDSASLIGTNLANADFSGSSLANANFTQAYLINSIFSGANLQNASLSKSYLQGASFASTVSVAGLNMVDAYVATQPGSWSFNEADGTPFVYAFDSTVLGDVATTTKGSATCPDGQLGPCTGAKLSPTPAAPYPAPPPPCIPVGPDYDNCLPPTLNALSKPRPSR